MEGPARRWPAARAYVRLFARPRSSRRSSGSQAKRRTSMCCEMTRTRSSHIYLFVNSPYHRADNPSYRRPYRPTSRPLRPKLLPPIRPPHARSCQSGAALELVLDMRTRICSPQTQEETRCPHSLRTAGHENRWSLWCVSLPHTRALSEHIPMPPMWHIRKRKESVIPRAR